MWTRVELKNRCKMVMARSYGKMLLVSLFTSFILGFLTFDYELIVSDPMIIYVLSICFILLDILASNPLLCGTSRFFVKNSYEPCNFTEIFFAFRSDHYWNVVKVMLVQKFKILLWSLLFVIPGIIKAYEYSMIPYLLAENPNMDLNEAFRLSKQMTDNQKMEMFILDLSFAGWYIVGILSCGIGLMLVSPYIYGVEAQLYLKLKELKTNTFYQNQ